jgi:type VI secretion system protein ImpL
VFLSGNGCCPSTAPSADREQFADPVSSATVQDALSRDFARTESLVRYAAPYIQWLKDGDTPSRVHEAPAASAVAYWVNTVSEIDTHRSANRSAGQVVTLEAVITSLSQEITYRNCHTTLQTLPKRPLGNDLFSERRSVATKLVERWCESKRGEKAEAVYRNLADRFNRELAGHYPFGELSSRDASPETVRLFFADYVDNRSQIREILVGRAGGRWEQRLQFVKSPDAIADLLLDGRLIGRTFKILITPQPMLNPPIVGVVPGHSQLVGWSLHTNNAEARFGGKGTPQLQWGFGLPLTLTLHWAERSAWRPIAAEMGAHMQSEGANLYVSAGGTWALLRLVEQLKRPAMKIGEGSAYIWPIEFRVPVNRIEPMPGADELGIATLSFALTLTIDDPVTNADKPLSGMVPFPRVAPALRD